MRRNRFCALRCSGGRSVSATAAATAKLPPPVYSPQPKLARGSGATYWVTSPTQSAAIAVRLRHLLCSRRSPEHLNCYVSTAYNLQLSGCSGAAVSSTDEAGNIRSYCPDGLGRLVGVTEPNANVTTVRLRHAGQPDKRQHGEPHASSTAR